MYAKLFDPTFFEWSEISDWFSKLFQNFQNSNVVSETISMWTQSGRRVLNLKMLIFMTSKESYAISTFIPSRNDCFCISESDTKQQWLSLKTAYRLLEKQRC